MIQFKSKINITSISLGAICEEYTQDVWLFFSLSRRLRQVYSIILAKNLGSNTTCIKATGLVTQNKCICKH